MENATKALLIAAAILIAILIISLGLVVYNMAAEQVSNANLSEVEMKAFNSKFENYHGKNRTGSEVNALLSTVMASNSAEKKSGSVNYVEVTVKRKSETEVKKLDSNSNSISSMKVPTNAYFTITCTYSNGLVSTIAVVENN